MSSITKSVASFFALTVLTLFLSGCSKENNSAAQLEADKMLIEQYITDNNLNATPTGSGLYIVIDAPGNGKTPNRNSTISIVYSGYRLDGFVFDETGNNPATLQLSGVIEGWKEGIPYFKEGGRGKLLVPSKLGYGTNSPSSDIPPNTVLVFDIELIAVY